MLEEIYLVLLTQAPISSLKAFPYVTADTVQLPYASTTEFKTEELISQQTVSTWKVSALIYFGPSF